MAETSKELQALVTWSYSPEAKTLPAILSALTPEDMLLGMSAFKSDPVGRMAWAEYGRRCGFIDFELSVVEAQGVLQIGFSGDARPAHHGPIFEVKEP